MKTQHSFASLASVCLFFNAVSALGQGALTPPGAPAPVMKSLGEIEPRTDVLKLSGDANNLFIITTPGSYYLTTNLVGVSGKNGISIASDNVTLDLNGFALLGVPGMKGIILAGVTNVTVHNGALSGWYLGVYGLDAAARNVVVDGLTVSGCSGDGLTFSCPATVRNCLCASNGYSGVTLNNGGRITDCGASDNAGDGIYALHGGVQNCHALNNGGNGIHVLQGGVQNCHVVNNRGNGINVAPGTVSGSSAQHNTGAGINVVSGQIIECEASGNGTYGIGISDGLVRNCRSANNGDYGVEAYTATVSDCWVENNASGEIFINAAGSEVIGNTCISTNTGIFVNDGNNRIEGNHVKCNAGAGTYGIYVSATYTGNVIVKNSVSSANVNYYTPGSQIVGPLITAYGTITNSNPWANFSD